MALLFTYVSAFGVAIGFLCSISCWTLLYSFNAIYLAKNRHCQFMSHITMYFSCQNTFFIFSRKKAFERRVDKLERELKDLKSSFKSFKRKMQEKGEQSCLGLADTSMSSELSDQEKEVNEILASVSYLSCNAEKEINECIKQMCFAVFTSEQLVNSSRTGKKTIKSPGEVVRPALDSRKLKILEMAVLKKCASLSSDLFKKKIDNIIKMTRRDAKAKN